MLVRFVTAFRRGIRGEMEAMRQRLGPFEVMLGTGEASSEPDGTTRYEVALPTHSDKLIVGAECTLRSGGREVVVTVEALIAGMVTLRGERAIELGTRTILVFYPWFLYEKLDRALECLSPQTFYVERALSLFGKGEPQHSPQTLSLDHSALNESQRAAVQLCSDNSLAFLWGPPGTGKTRTLGHVVRELLAQGKRLLLVSTTNSAVDQGLSQIANADEGRAAIERGLVVRLGRTKADSHGAALHEVMGRLHEGRTDALRALRRRHREVGAMLRRLLKAQERLQQKAPAQQTSLFAEPEPPALRPTDLEGVFTQARSRRLCRAAHETLAATLKLRAARLQRVAALCKDSIARHEAVLRSDEGTVVGQARAILTTLTGAYFNQLLEGQRFDVVVAEEASMAILPSLFYAACLARDKTIMVGDPRQLPPIVHSEDPQVRRTMGRSIFEVTVPQPQASPHVVMLDTQYRMHPRIGELVSDLFYNGRLRHGEGTETRAAIAGRAPYPGEPLIVVDTAGTSRCKSRRGSGSRYNDQSAELCVQLALEGAQAGAASVAVITPYADQARDIRSRLRRAGADHRIECSTVHRFQGHERDLVIFDTVDAAPMRPGVLLNDARSGTTARNLINVSLSRARGKLIVVSDVAYFERNAPQSAVTAALRGMLTANSPRVPLPG
ncbi:MAG: AAA domain-containing protein [Myxococcales bacterium]|nr:AAA domain-containing protein [Myxococcales bacterium]